MSLPSIAPTWGYLWRSRGVNVLESKSSDRVNVSLVEDKWVKSFAPKDSVSWALILEYYQY